MAMYPDMDVSPIVVDVETCGLPNAADYLEPVTPDARLKDPAKIEADIADKTAARLDRLGLDWNVGRIVAIGYWTEQRDTVAYVCQMEEDEQRELSVFWRHAKQRTIVTFNGRNFDLPFMIQRSRYLGIAHPTLDLRPYGGGQGNVDLYLELTFGRKDSPCMRQTLRAFCRRFGIPVTDEIAGKDIPAMVAAGEWDKVVSHVTSDVDLTVALARRIGVVQPQPEPSMVA